MIILVSTEAELQSAYQQLSSLSGGGEIHLTAEAEGIDLKLTGGGTEHVTITSADLDNPVAVGRIHFRTLENVTVRSVDVDSTGIDRDDAEQDFFVGRSENITFDDVHFSGQATGYFDPDAKVDSVGAIRSSSDITIQNSSFSNYFQGLWLYESSGITIEYTEITQMQGDGLRMEGVQDIRILNNHFHDFYGSPNNINHDDMIQMWNMNTDIISRDIEISGNVFNASGGVGSQTIFIGNERGGHDPATYYENISVTNNVIINGDRSGIRVSATHNVEVSGNTLLWDEEVGISGRDGSFSTSPPGIKLVKVTNATITDNITSHIEAPDGTVISGNNLISYDSPTDADYVGNHFVNATGAGQLDIRDLSLRADSEYVGSGSPYSQPDVALGTDQAVLSSGSTDADLWVWSFDAGASSVDGQDVDYTWTFDDGVQMSGITVERLFESPGVREVTLEVSRGGEVIDQITRGFEVENRDFVVLDFDTYGLNEVAGDGADIGALDEDQLSSGGYRIGGAQKIEIGRSTDTIHNLTQFGLEVELQLVEPGDDGTFLHFARVMQGRILADGSVSVSLTTDEGTFEVAGGAGTFSDTGMHTIGLEYDGVAGRFDLHIDGEIVSSVPASGVTAARTSFGLNIGHSFGSSIEADVASVYFGYDLDRGPDPDWTPSEDEDQEEPEDVVPEKSYGDNDGPLILPGPGDLTEHSDKSANSDPNATLSENAGQQDPDAVEPETSSGDDTGPLILPEQQAPAEGPDMPADPDPVEAAPEAPEAPEADVPSAAALGALEIHLQMDNGVASAGGGVRLLNLDQDNFDTHEGEGVYRIGGEDKLTIARGNAEIHNLDSFSFQIEMSIDEVGAEGRFLHFHKVMTADLQEDGTVTFRLQTDEGRFELTSERAIFTDTEMHSFGIVYDGDQGLMTMYANGEEVGQTEATGTTADRSYFGLTLGREWGGSLDASINDFRFHGDHDGASSNPNAQAAEAGGAEAQSLPFSAVSLEEVWRSQDTDTDSETDDRDDLAMAV